jgi:hypothetical protein
MIGPRATRRFVWVVGLAIGVAVFAGAIRHLTRSSHPASNHAKETLGAPENLGVPFGASPAKVVARLGQPNAKQAGCWIYGVKDGAKEIGNGFGQWIDKVKYCFSEGATGGQVVADISSHMVAHRIGKKHYPAGWN